MVHNGIEYGIMGAIAEGLAILKKADVGLQEHAKDAETAPLRDPAVLPVPLRHARDRRGLAPRQRRQLVAARPDRRGPARGSRRARASPGRVSDSGEGRWTALAAIEESVPAHVLTTALYERFSSRGEADYADKLLSAMRQQFGGHAEQKPARVDS